MGMPFKVFFIDRVKNLSRFGFTERFFLLLCLNHYCSLFCFWAKSALGVETLCLL